MKGVTGCMGLGGEGGEVKALEVMRLAFSRQTEKIDTGFSCAVN